ncbi:MAG: L-threonine synthase [Candidatus Kaiserbacteria bacterium GW2011_GWA2_49_19]|uniref:Threonine synthase n=2 Tax=Candidatus Kaiseribacteriota TaxID=1752734 RepID=A0A0G1XZU6_9BACT|nr:MAG: L-threonine synthase [Candidatus Kaiserbacteria bacterium GW2011_GWA2_49_19]OGG58811.1 MAG: threonine synthase [Candidatus Kaiserbacteria bacterium RIFCSPHIGHO2_02_FULL_49_16]
MRYISTRGNSESREFKEILLEGLAPDGGLYVPEQYPKFTDAELDDLRGKTYQETALNILRTFITDIPEEDLRGIIARTYTKEIFGTDAITPLKHLEKGLSLLQLSNGPTLAFKDVPLQLLGNLMEYVLEERGSELNILGATSGDTGSAAAYALKGKKNIRLFMLSPYGRMSRFQQRQMYTLNEPNIFNIVVNGTFDDCQTIVKEANADAEFKKKYKLGAVNSINWARISAQIVYYFYSYLRLTKDNSKRVAYAVPSGNFGNALSAHIASKMGLNIEIIVCTNENDVLDQFFKTGIYRVLKGNDVKITSSPSMDIASASNFERFIFDYVGRDSAKVRVLWKELNQKREFDIGRIEPRVPFGITSGSATDAEVLDTIRIVYKKYAVVIDPHTAVAMKVGLEKCEKGVPLVVIETAQPAKFADTIREALGIEVPAPKGYENLANLPEKTTRIENDAELVKKFIEENT